jgi:DNA-binding transcriptional MerR regulator
MTRADVPLMQIREFSTRSRLTQKALRLYDALGLLEPAHVDAQSGYRYYNLSQLERAQLIGFFRQLEMPLNRIAYVLELQGEAAAFEIRNYWNEVEQNIKDKRGLVTYLEQKLNPKPVRNEEIMFEVKTREVAEQKIASIQFNVFAKELPARIEQSFKAIFKQIALSPGVEAIMPTMVIYHGTVNEDSDGPIEACIPFIGNLEPAGDIRIRLEPTHREAFTTITKSQVVFPEILQAYDAVETWIGQNNFQPSLSCREVYFADFMNARDTDPVCDIAFPI